MCDARRDGAAVGVGLAPPPLRLRWWDSCSSVSPLVGSLFPFAEDGERLHSARKLVVQLRVDPSGQSFKRLLVAEQSCTAAADSGRLLSSA